MSLARPRQPAARVASPERASAPARPDRLCARNGSAPIRSSNSIASSKCLTASEYRPIAPASRPR